MITRGELPTHGREHLSHHRNRGRADEDDEDAGENEEHQREDELHRGFGGFLFRNLAAAGSHAVALHAESLSDAGTEFVRLNEN